MGAGELDQYHAEVSPAALSGIINRRDYVS